MVPILLNFKKMMAIVRVSTTMRNQAHQEHLTKDNQKNFDEDDESEDNPFADN